MQRFENKTVLVTGGTSGIGLATARAFANEGAVVGITGRSTRDLANVEQLVGKGAWGIANDVTQGGAHAALASALNARAVKLDAVFINAGITRFAPFEAVTESLWDDTFNTNAKGAYFQIQALLPCLNSGASIVLNGSINAHIGAPNSSVYAASKAALISLAKTLSAELLPRGVRVNVVSCGPIETPLYQKLGIPASQQDATISQIRSLVPLGRFGRPEEAASTVLHLAAVESAFIVGTEIIVDGGMSQL